MRPEFRQMKTLLGQADEDNEALVKMLRAGVLSAETIPAEMRERAKAISKLRDSILKLDYEGSEQSERPVYDADAREFLDVLSGPMNDRKRLYLFASVLDTDRVSEALERLSEAVQDPLLKNKLLKGYAANLLTTDLEGHIRRMGIDNTLRQFGHKPSKQFKTPKELAGHIRATYGYDGSYIGFGLDSLDDLMRDEPDVDFSGPIFEILHQLVNEGKWKDANDLIEHLWEKDIDWNMSGLSEESKEKLMQAQLEQCELYPLHPASKPEEIDDMGRFLCECEGHRIDLALLFERLSPNQDKRQ